MKTIVNCFFLLFFLDVSSFVLLQMSSLLETPAALGGWRYFMIRRGCQCVMLSLTSRMQRLCVESWTVGLLYRCWEQLLLTKETLRCGHKRFSAEEMSLRFISVQHHHYMKANVLMIITRGCYVLVRIKIRLIIKNTLLLFVASLSLYSSVT